LFAYTKLRSFPAFVIYSIDRASILRDWYRRIALSGALAAAFAAIMFIITSFALRHARTEAAAIEQLQRTSSSLREEIERRERAEASLLQAQRLDAVGRLTGGIAHDFNNLLQVISGNLDLAQRRSDLAGIRRTVQSAQYAAKRGADLTRRLLAFSRQQTLQPEAVNLNTLLDRARTWLGRTISDTIDMQFRCEEDLWPVQVDVPQFEAALLNLVVNARDAMPRGGALLFQTRNVTLPNEEIAAHDLAVPAGAYVCCSLTDTGSGIPPDVLARVFEPFFTTKDIGKGSGLGLSQIYGFVRQSGGTMTIKSEVGRGTTVALYLPRSDAPVVEQEAVAEPSNVESLDHSGIVLIVEDNDEVRRVASTMLDELGYTTILARNGIEALAVLSAGEPIDVLFSDILMPRTMSGIELAQRACAMRPDLKVLLTTASREVKTNFPLLRKPYTQVELDKKIRQLLPCRAASQMSVSA
jgi:signal transduction histidine kinase/CheY-like chemotaxis protein